MDHIIRRKLFVCFSAVAPANGADDTGRFFCDVVLEVQVQAAHYKCARAYVCNRYSKIVILFGGKSSEAILILLP